MMWRLCAATAVGVWLAWHSARAWGDEPVAEEKNAKGEKSSEPRLSLFDVPSPTFGGMQFWSDELVHHDWRIQRNVVTGHCRLLDDQNFRHAWGSYDDCRQAFDALKEANQLPPVNGKVVIVLHGLVGTRFAMTDLCRHLHDKGEYTPINVSYASTRGSLADHAASLAKVIQNLDGATEIDFVAHSLGNLVLRHYLADQTNPEKNLRPDARIKRIVMLAPPNNGATLAVRFKDQKLLEVVLGQSAKQLAAEGPKICNRLATPPCEFAIIAGGQGDDDGINPLINGDDDLVVSVAETRLPGARDFAVLPIIHRKMSCDPTVCEYTLRFLQHGYLVSEEQRQPITVDAAAAARDEPRSTKSKNSAKRRTERDAEQNR